MPYKNKSDLPESVKHVLPAHAQDIRDDTSPVSAADSVIVGTAGLASSLTSQQKTAYIHALIQA